MTNENIDDKINEIKHAEHLDGSVIKIMKLITNLNPLSNLLHPHVLH